ncbi:MAG TPA: aminopeptidase P N-terminal domain-containing protein [Pyrinomonadaceae bacterium]|nr:aminopeptidase P N-terminal domain-containing protein [Pyrinomonadaceae bacterium]
MNSISRCRLVLLAALCLLSLLSTNTPAQDIPLFTSDFPPQEFAARRSKMFDAIGEGGLALVQGAAAPVGYTRFRQSNEFYYLCGVEVPHAYLLLNGAQRTTAPYLPHRKEGRERNEGKMLSAEDAELVKQLSGVDAVYGTDLLAEHLGRYARYMQSRTIWTPFSPAEGASMSRDLATRAVADASSDPWDGTDSREGRLIGMLRTRFPQFEVRDLTPALDQSRLIKSQREIELIRKATRLSGLALLEAMRSTVPGISEYELDAVAKYVYYRNGAQGDAYYSLIASGPNAMFPHYNAGKRVMRDGELLLMDYAPDYGYYMSDVTRMWPVNGKFSDWQREVYGFYLECYRAILSHIRPGATAASIMREASADMRRTLARTKFSKPIYEAAARKFVEGYESWAAEPCASLGHWVGMATHDIGRDCGPLRPGMVFTIEPDLRVPEEKIYIRLEDMIIIGERKADILTTFVPMDIQGIESLMREDGMLQRYARDGGR